MGSNVHLLPDQIIENKQRFIGQVMTSKNPARSCEDVDATALSYAEVKALATGDPRIKEKMNLDVEIANLRNLKADYLSQQYQFEDDLAKRIPREIQNAKTAIGRLETARDALASHPMGGEHFSMEINGKLYTERKAAGAAIIDLCLSDKRPEGLIGSFRGFEMRLAFDELAKQFKVELKNGAILSAEVSEDAVGTINRINNAVEKVPELLTQRKDTLEGLTRQVETIRVELEKPFPHTKELEQKEERLTVLLQELAEAEKEQSAKRALRKSENAPEHAETAEQKDNTSITKFIQDFQPVPSMAGSRTQDERER